MCECVYNIYVWNVCVHTVKKLKNDKHRIQSDGHLTEKASV